MKNLNFHEKRHEMDGLTRLTHQGGIKFKPELRVRNQDYGGMKVDHFVVEKR